MMFGTLPNCHPPLFIDPLASRIKFVLAIGNLEPWTGQRSRVFYFILFA